MSVPTAQYQQSPYIREQRNFPYDNLKDLSQQVDLAYIDLARNINQRTIGTYPLNFFVVTGEKAYLEGNSKPQQILRRIYTFTSFTDFDHGIKTETVTSFMSCYGSYTDGTNFYGLPFCTNQVITNQNTFYLNSTQIKFLTNGTAPSISGTGIIVLQWISQY